MKRILSVFLCIALLCGGIAVYAVAEEQTVEERVAEMLTHERESGQVVVNFRDGVTREEAERMFVENGVLTDPADPEVVLRCNWDFLPQEIPLSYTLYVGEERISDVLVFLLQNELVRNACPNYTIPLEDPGEIFYRGDVDTDGDVDANDYLLLKRAVIGTYKLTEAGALRADANGNGRIDSFDYLLVKRHVLGTFKLGIEWSV